MKLVLLFCFLAIGAQVHADVFSKKDEASLEELLRKDDRADHFRLGPIYSPDKSMDQRAYELRRQNVSLGCNRYDLHESLKSYMLRPEFNTIEVEQIMQRIASSRLSIWQYSSPSTVDIYKHLYTSGQMRLGMRYQQCEDLERTADDPLIKLRKQSIMECIKRIGGRYSSEDMDAAFRACFEHTKDGQGVNLPFESLADPQNGASYIKERIDLTDKVLSRLDQDDVLISSIKDVLPRVMLDTSSVIIRPARVTKAQLIASYSKDVMDIIERLKDDYDRKQVIDEGLLKELNVAGAVMTKSQLVNIFILEETASSLSIRRLAAEIAYLKVIELYTQASRMLDLVMVHPAIEQGYKRLLAGVVEFPIKEMESMRLERLRLNEYYRFMVDMIREGDRQREKTAAFENELFMQRKAGYIKGIAP